MLGLPPFFAAFPAFRARIASILAGVLPRSGAPGAEASIPDIAGRFARMLVGVGVLLLVSGLRAVVAVFTAGL